MTLEFITADSKQTLQLIRELAPMFLVLNAPLGVGVWLLLKVMNAAGSTGSDGLEEDSK
jgi:hypothetical protein